MDVSEQAPLAVITNRLSTRNAADGDWVSPFLADDAGAHHFILERVEDVADVVRRCEALGVRTIAVNGGDGTAGLVFGALLNDAPYSTPPAVALLPAGKTNMTAAGWSLGGRKEDALGKLLSHWRAGTLNLHVVERHVLELRQAADRLPLYGAFFGAADVVEGIQYCRRRIYPMDMPNALSHSAAIAVLLWRALFGAGGSGEVAVESEGAVMESGRFNLVAVTALDELLLGIRPEPAEGEGALNYLSLRGGLPVLRALPQLAGRRIGPGAGRTVRRANEITLRFTGPYTLDGEIYYAEAGQPLVVDGRRTLRFVRFGGP